MDLIHHAYRGDGGGARRGVVMVWLLLCLPVFLAAIGLVIDGGLAYVNRSLLHSASDLGALAGVQDLDLQRLADGERYIIPNRARQDALQVTNRIIAANRRWRDWQVEVWVTNPGEGGRMHPFSGRRLLDPTVTVRASVQLSSVFMRWLIPSYDLTAYADASVLPRRD